MNRKILQQRTWLHLISAVILLAGLSSAAVIYHRAGSDSYGASGYEGGDGTIFPITPENSKLYRHNLEVYGGKFSVIMDDFRRWFIGLWQGKPLAIIIACTTILISFGFFSAAKHAPPPRESKAPPEDNPDGTG